MQLVRLQDTIHSEYNYGLDDFPFIRHYLKSQCWFTFHCILICLNLACSLTWSWVYWVKEKIFLLFFPQISAEEILLSAKQRIEVELKKKTKYILSAHQLLFQIPLFIIYQSQSALTDLWAYLWQHFFVACNKRQHDDSSKFNTPQGENFCITKIKGIVWT